MNPRRYTFALAAATGGVLAAMSLSSAVAVADILPIPGDPGFSIVGDPDDGPLEITGVTGLAPFYTTVEEQGSFLANGIGAVGNASYYSDMFGLHNVLFERIFNGEPTQIVDQLNFGSGWENAYDDIIGGGANGTNSITDTLITPFGDFNIPTDYDAAAVFDPSNFSPVAEVASALDPSSFAAALDADWTTFVTDLAALF
jgi:hypothetical protein